jgi:hypothetical protein
MALIPKFCAELSNDCKTLVITDLTGNYSLVNLGGWGAPNPLYANRISANIRVEKRNADGTYTNATFSPVVVFPTLPSNVNGTYNLTAEDAGYGTDAKWSDGIYKLTYTIIGLDGIVTYSVNSVIYLPLTCEIDCCVKKKGLEVSKCNCDCEDLAKKQRNIMIQYRLLQSAKCCANLDELQEYIDKLTKLCSQCGCS